MEAGEGRRGVGGGPLEHTPLRLSIAWLMMTSWAAEVTAVSTSADTIASSAAGSKDGAPGRAVAAVEPPAVASPRGGVGRAASGPCVASFMLGWLRVCRQSF